MIYFNSHWNMHIDIGTCSHTVSNMCHGDREAMTFLHWKDRCTGCQGPPGPGYGPINTVVCRLRDGKATAGNVLPTMVAQDVMSYRMSGRWRMRLYVAAYIIIQRYKSSCALVPGSFFVSLAAGVLKYPTSQLSHHELSLGLYRATL